MNLPLPIRVVGVGSPLGDDALAWEAVRKLQREMEWGTAIEFHGVEGGQGLLDLLDSCGTLFLIDALASDVTPGTIRRFEWPDPGIESLRPGTTHHLRPAEALQLAATLGLLPPRVVIWAVTGECFGPQAGLSPTVKAAIPELVERIIAELDTTRNSAATDRACCARKPLSH